MSLNNGYYEIPSGIYFGGSQFSILVWVKVKIFTVSSRIIEVSNGRGNNNIILGLTQNLDRLPVCKMFSDSITLLTIKSTIELSLNVWHHLTCVFSSPNGYIYINGTSYTTITDPFAGNPNSVVRSSNFVGRSNWYPTDQDTNADLDELKIFNRSLTQKEILQEMNNNIYL